MTCEFSVPTVTPSLNVWQRMNRFAKPKLTQTFAWECRAYRPLTWPTPPPNHVRVSIVRIGKKLLDRDNLYGGAKAAVDGLKHAGFIADDSDAHIDLHITQEVTRDRPHMRIRLET